MQNKIRLIGLVAVTVCMAMASTVHATYWSLFNIEGESTLSANYVTYASLNDMLTDTNRLDVFQPDPFGFGRNIVGSGSDGTAYWSLFNIEGESTLSANYVTYASLNDMLTDTNRLGVFQPDPFGFGRNIVGSGSDNKANNPRPMPESPTLVLLGIGLAGFAVARRKKINEY